MLSNRKRDFIIILGVAAVLMLLPIGLGEYYLYLIRLVGVYVILALGLNIIMGYAGHINLCSAAFFCIGAYGSTLLQVHLGWHYLIAFIGAIFLSFLAAWGISYPLLRLRGHVSAIGTLAFALAIFLVAERFPEFTGGEDGIMVPKMALFGHMAGNTFYYYFILVFVVVAYVFCYLLVNSRIGRAFLALRESEEAAAAVGVDVVHFKRLAWMVSGVLGGIAGSLYAQQAGFLSPSTFSLWTNIIVLVYILVGGMGSNLGSVVGTVIMALLPHLIAGMEEYVLIMNGIILFLFLRFLPAGIVGSFAVLIRRHIHAEKRLEAAGEPG